MLLIQLKASLILNKQHHYNWMLCEYELTYADGMLVA